MTHATAPEDLRERAERLRERFPDIAADRVLQVLRDNGGHAGYAAADLRALSTDVVKSADPEDSEHVATLLSNHTLFKQTCRAHFKKFDANRNGTLEWDEVMQLMNHLSRYMGLELPSEKSIQAFFESSDANHDGVLAEREFPKFFESFLRYAFFMQHRRVVGTWLYKGDAMGFDSEFTITLGKDYRLNYRSTRGGCPGTPKAQVPQGRTEVHGALELYEGWMQAELKVGNRSHDNFFGLVRLKFIEGATDKVIVNFKSDAQASWGNDVVAKRRSTIEEDRVARHQVPEIGNILRCIAPHGVAYRRAPEYHERTEDVLPPGETIRVADRHHDTHWVCVAGGWLPTVDPKGIRLFEIESA